MLEKTRTVVSIGGKEYAMAGEESEEYIHRVAMFVDKKINELKANYINLSTNELAILTAVNIADELIKMKYEHTGAMDELFLLKEDIKKLKIENALLKDEKKDKVTILKKEHGNKIFDNFK